ncbi:hypothetical protein XELAEV_18043717mg [Xenopus laevis]|uniref:Uncharacterized protein n=1 Tax=Xenopus laevis TaxID=8355 RepID=A0A974BXP7_XENLA|nr:hypothetical protein XELAEV_18043717mg [Xenopus laevis]
MGREIEMFKNCIRLQISITKGMGIHQAEVNQIDYKWRKFRPVADITRLIRQERGEKEPYGNLQKCLFMSKALMNRPLFTSSINRYLYATLKTPLHCTALRNMSAPKNNIDFPLLENHWTRLV